MKALVCVAAAVVQVMFAGGIGEDSLTKALTRGADVDIGIRVVDDEGAPVADAECCGWIYLERDAKRGCRYSVLTDTNGLVRIVGRSSEWVSVNVSKEGYYGSQEKIVYPAACDSPVVDGKWQPYGETRTIVLKRVKNPGAMRGATYGQYYDYPELDVWTGFDLESCEWMPPLGSGKFADMLVRIKRQNIDDGYRKTMEVSFTNNAYAGVYELCRDSVSEMDGEYRARTNGTFKAGLVYEFSKTAKGNQINELLSSQYLVFCTRTRLDEEGNLVSAHYGKIYGNWRFSEKGGMSIGRIVFNPTPNDTNLEDAETYRMSLVRRKQKLEFERRRKAKEK